ncbi:MAG TPA: FMN-binding negative transcriptional regulator [Moraxellaceae bacterium]|nr:FMN-binding negative transcriptional regulator [Moraxellaceae bacterium]
MYVPSHFQPPGTAAMHDMIEAYPLAMLVTLKEGFPVVDHIPLLLARQEGTAGILTGHVARANPLWTTHPPAVEVLTVFQGPAAYISPGWYPAKAESGRVVPTWNYVSVQAKGTIRFITDPDWLLSHLTALTNQQERALSPPWQVSDAPADFIHQMIQSVVGVEIAITDLSGKWKVSQNRPAADIAPLAERLQHNGNDEMARIVRQRLER